MECGFEKRRSVACPPTDHTQSSHLQLCVAAPGAHFPLAEDTVSQNAWLVDLG
jgi:hypothetical protein